MNVSFWIRFTEIFISVILSIVIGVDLILANNGVANDTISEVIRTWVYTKGWFVATWAWGVLAGHLFLTRSEPIFENPDPRFVLLGITLLVFILGVPGIIKASFSLQVVLLVLGIIAGYLLWPQDPVI